MASFLSRVLAQVNPFDNGATYSNPSGNRTVFDSNAYSTYQNNATPEQIAAAYSPNNTGAGYSTDHLNLSPVLADPAPGGTGTAGGGTDLTGTIYDPTAISALKGQISARQQQANDLYNSLFGQIDALANDRRNTIQSQYGTTFQNNDNAYNQAVDQTNGAFLGRGAYDSSYRGNALNSAKTDYQNSNQQLTDAENNNLAQIGQFADTTKQSINSSKPQYDLSQYNDVNQLQSLYDQLGQHIQNLQGQQAGLKTNSQYVSDLNSISPQSSSLSSQLASQLSKLAQSSAPADAKLAMADAYITRNGEKGNADYWSKYFMNLLQPQAPQTTPTAPVA